MICKTKAATSCMLLWRCSASTCKGFPPRCWHTAGTESLLLRWMGGRISRRKKALVFASHGYTWACRDQPWSSPTCSAARCSFPPKLSAVPWFFLLPGVPWESEGLTSSEHDQDISNWFSPLLSFWKMAANKFLKTNRGTRGALISKQLDHVDVHEHIFLSAFRTSMFHWVCFHVILRLHIDAVNNESEQASCLHIVSTYLTSA